MPTAAWSTRRPYSYRRALALALWSALCLLLTQLGVLSWPQALYAWAAVGVLPACVAIRGHRARLQARCQGA